jgi:hypothetical protein
MMQKVQFASSRVPIERTTRELEIPPTTASREGYFVPPSLAYVPSPWQVMFMLKEVGLAPLAQRAKPARWWKPLFWPLEINHSHQRPIKVSTSELVSASWSERKRGLPMLI